MKYDYSEYALMFKALSDGTRLNILQMLSNGQLCACNILEHFHITQPTLSYHMKILTDCGLVDAVRDGAWMKYSLNSERLKELEEILSLINVPNSTCGGDCECK